MLLTIPNDKLDFYLTKEYIDSHFYNSENIQDFQCEDNRILFLNSRYISKNNYMLSDNISSVRRTSSSSASISTYKYVKDCEYELSEFAIIKMPFVMNEDYSNLLDNNLIRIPNNENKKILAFRNIKIDCYSNKTCVYRNDYHNLKYYRNHSVWDSGFCSVNYVTSMSNPPKNTIRNQIMWGYRQAAIRSALQQGRFPCEDDLKGLDFPDGTIPYDHSDATNWLTHTPNE